MFGRNKKQSEYLVELYKNDLNVEITKILHPEKNDGIKEYFYVMHSDAVDEHYHVYLSLGEKMREKDVKKIFYNAKCFVSELPKDKTLLNLIYSFTNGFRLPLETSYNAKPLTKK